MRSIRRRAQEIFWLALVVIMAAGVVRAADDEAQVADPYANRPKTKDFIEQKVRPRVKNSAETELKSQIERLQKVGPNGKLEVQILAEKEQGKYQGGVGVIEGNLNAYIDAIKLVPKAFECMKVEFRGICLRPDFNDPYTLLIRYYFPTFKVEAVDQPFKSMFISSQLMSVYKGYAASLWKSLAQQVAKTALKRGMLGSRLLPAQMGVQLQAGAGAGDSGGGLEVGIAAALAMPDKYRWRNPFITQAGTRFSEYHLMAEELNRTLGRTGIFCHQILNPYWLSEFPFGFLMSRYALYSFLYWPSEMLTLMGSPTACGSRNISKGYTPADMFSPLLQPPSGAPGLGDIAAQLGGGFGGVGGKKSEGGGCQDTNAGPWLPVTTEVHSVYFADASRLAFRKAVEVAKLLTSSSMYSWHKDVDKVSFVHNDRMSPDCVRLEQSKLADDPNAESIRAEGEPLNVVIGWFRSTCCMSWRLGDNDIVFVFSPFPPDNDKNAIGASGSTATGARRYIRDR